MLAMAREIYLAGVNEEELRPEPKPEGPKTVKGKWENFWYHYKWPTILITAAVIVLAVMFYQIFSKDNPDYLVVLVTKDVVTDNVSDKLAAELQPYGRDIDGNGKVEVQVEAINVDNTSQLGMINKQKLLAHFSAGDAMFFIFDKQSYDDNITELQSDGSQFFSKLDVQADGLGNNGYYWNWKNDPMRKDSELSTLPEDLYFGVRDVSGTASNKKSVKMHDECLELLEAYITKTPLTSSAGQ